jgi:hypothetical protein
VLISDIHFPDPESSMHCTVLWVVLYLLVPSQVNNSAVYNGQTLTCLPKCNCIFFFHRTVWIYHIDEHICSCISQLLLKILSYYVFVIIGISEVPSCMFINLVNHMTVYYLYECTC